MTLWHYVDSDLVNYELFFSCPSRYVFLHFYLCIVRIVVLPLMLSMSRHNSEECFDCKVQRTMLEIVNQLDGFDSRGNVKVGRKISVQLLGNI